jgi:hypothetical protein
MDKLVEICIGDFCYVGVGYLKFPRHQTGNQFQILVRALNAAYLDYPLTMLLKVCCESLQEFVREFVLHAASAPTTGTFLAPCLYKYSHVFSL